LLILAFLCAVLKFTVCNENYMVASAKNSGYVGDVKEYVTREFLNLSEVSRIPRELIDDFIEENFEETDVLYSITSSYGGRIKSLNFTPLKKSFEEMLYSYALTLDAEIDFKEFSENISDQAERYVEIYKEAVCAESFFVPFKAAVSVINNYSGLVFIFSIAVALILFFVLYMKNKGTLKGNRYIYYSFSSASVVLIFSSFLALYFDVAKKTVLRPQYIFNFVSSFLESVFVLVFCLGISILILTVVLMIYKSKRSR